MINEIRLNCSEIALKLLWKCSESALKVLWKCSESALKVLWEAGLNNSQQSMEGTKDTVSNIFNKVHLALSMRNDNVSVKLVSIGRNWLSGGRSYHGYAPGVAVERSRRGGFEIGKARGRLLTQLLFSSEAQRGKQIPRNWLHLRMCRSL